jgi:quinolinate synthase
MHTNYVVLIEGTPMLIDSQFKIYAVESLRSTHNDMWLMAHPSGLTEVTFELKAQGSGREAARALFTRQLEKQTWLTDLDERRQLLGEKQSLLEMAAIVQSQKE